MQKKKQFVHWMQSWFYEAPKAGKRNSKNV
jgi:hypothetical protein